MTDANGTERISKAEMEAAQPIDTPPLPSYSELAAEVKQMRDDMSEMIRLLNVIKDQVGPALEAIASSPVGRMFGMK